jgi:hypothetical protein
MSDRETKTDITDEAAEQEPGHHDSDSDSSADGDDEAQEAKQLSEFYLEWKQVEKRREFLKSLRRRRLLLGTATDRIHTTGLNPK